MEELSNTISKMDIDVKFPLKPGATAAEITLRPGQKIIAEGGSMIAMSSNISMTTTTQQKKSGGIMKGLKRMISGENFFLNHYTAGSEGGKLWLGTTHVGDMDCKELNGESLVIQGGSYVACSENIEIDASWQGFKNLVSKESMFWVKATGKGTVIFNSFGAIYTAGRPGQGLPPVPARRPARRLGLSGRQRQLQHPHRRRSAPERPSRRRGLQGQSRGALCDGLQDG